VVEIAPELFIDLALMRISLSDVPTGSALSLSGARASEIALVFE
jgi:hypothetical protein